MNMREFAFLIVGWLLGLLAAIIHDVIRERKTTARARQAIRVELEELRYRLAGVVYQVAGHAGMLDRSLAEWLQATASEYKGTYKREEKKLDLKPLLEATDEQISAMTMSLKAKPGKVLTFRKYQLPFFDANLNQLSSFTPQEQASLLDIRAQLHLFHDLVDDAHFFHQLTFDSSLSEANRGNVESNLREAHSLIAERAKGIANRIGDFLLDKGEAPRP
jgi:hypothetical protein